METLPGSSESDLEDDCAVDNSDPDRIVGDGVTFDDFRQASGDSVNTRGLLFNPVPGAGVASDSQSGESGFFGRVMIIQVPNA